MTETPTTEVFQLAQMRLMIAAATLRILLKANFNPSQPRIPLGEPGGGR